MVPLRRRSATSPIRWTRRDTLLGLVASAIGASAPRAQAPDRPLVGALRWDAWYAPGSEPTMAVERSLAPPRYQSRMPFFARRETGRQLSLPAMSASLMDLEIAQAAYAGLDFWAF